MSTATTLLTQLAPTGNKTQLVRLLDVFVFGPLMIVAAKDQSNAYFKGALTAIGIGTIVYNGVNYLAEARAARAGDTDLPANSASRDVGLGCGRIGTSDLARPSRVPGRRPRV